MAICSKAYQTISANVSPVLLYRRPNGPAANHLGQTFEGGLSGQPDVEAHGGYAFCALGCLSILDSPDRIIPR